jgi:hypothetical protein
MCPTHEVSQTPRSQLRYIFRKGKVVGISSELLQMGFIEFGLLASSEVLGSLLVYGYQNWLKKK